MKFSAILSFALFFLIVIAVFSLLNWFVFWRIRKGLNISGQGARYLAAVFVLLSLSFLVGQFLMRSLRLELLYMVGASWLGILSLALTVFAVEWLLSSVFGNHQRLIFLASAALILAATIFGLIRGLAMPQVKQIDLYYRELPDNLDGLKIMQISDLHLNGNNALGRLEYVADRIDQLRPDVIFITGDLVDSKICEMERLCLHLSRWKAPRGVYAVTGNHEYYVGVKEFLKLAGQMEWKVLQNEFHSDGQGLEIAGIDDLQAASFGFPLPDIGKFLRGLPEKKGFRVFLNHRPFNFAEAAAAGVDLQLSGHTHAGQIPPMDLLVMLSYKYPYGLYQLNGSRLYTTSGTGLWGPPIRIFSANELVLFRLNKEDK